MKKLQNDFTTPEQSKRLLELGVPEDSANYCYECSLIGCEKYYSRELLDDTTFTEYKRNWESPCVDVIPCWSVGRLIEIHAACAGASSSYYIHAFPTNIMNEVMWHLTEAVRHGWVDFSKLED